MMRYKPHVTSSGALSSNVISSEAQRSKKSYPPNATKISHPSGFEITSEVRTRTPAPPPTTPVISSEAIPTTLVISSEVQRNEKSYPHNSTKISHPLRFEMTHKLSHLHRRRDLIKTKCSLKIESAGNRREYSLIIVNC